MRRNFVLFLAAFGLLASGFVSADNHEDKVQLGIGYHIKVKPGHAQDVAEGIKDFLAFRAANNDPMNWGVFQVVGGHDVGDFIFYSGNNAWDAMDAYDNWEAGAEASAMWGSLAKKHVEDVESWMDRAMPDVSRWPEDGDYPLIWVTTLNLKPGVGEQWAALVKRFHEAIVATDYPAHYAISRGELPHGNSRTMVWPYKSWGDMADPDVTIYEMLSSHYGEEEAQSMFEKWSSYFTKEENMVVRFRGDLMPSEDEE